MIWIALFQVQIPNMEAPNGQNAFALRLEKLGAPPPSRAAGCACTSALSIAIWLGVR
jgi:hypothetical protein